MAQSPDFSRSAGVFARWGAGGRSDVFYLYAARAARGFGDGFAAIILPAYLLEIGLNPFQIGIVATAALLGSAATTLAIGYLGPRYDVRTLLLVCAVLMIVTGIAIPNLQHLWFHRGDRFRRHDESDHRRYRGTYTARAGLAGAGRIGQGPYPRLRVLQPDRRAIDRRWGPRRGRPGLAGCMGNGQDRRPAGDVLRVRRARRAGCRCSIHAFRAPTAKPEVPQASALGPSRRTVYKLAALFSLDAFASGFVVQSLLALWLFERFELSLSAASAFFFWSNVLAAFSYPVAAHIGKRFGLVNTMVFTHIPASICLILVAFCWNLPLAIFLLLVRAALSQMDVPTRTSYVMAIVTPPERTIAASFTAVPRSLASSLVQHWRGQ